MTVRSSGNPRASFRDRFLGTGNRASNPVRFSASGGTKTTSGSYTYHIFSSSGAFQVESGSFNVEYLVVAGGGAGGAGNPAGTGGGGGGGAGGFRTNVSGHPLASPNAFPVSPGPYTVTVGAGGAAVPNAGNGGNGSNGGHSAFGPIRSEGGGGGNAWGTGTSNPPYQIAENGGSGGGHARSWPSPGNSGTGGFGINPSTPGPILAPFSLTAPYPLTQGNPGGDRGGTCEGGAGGGGAGSAGTNSNTGTTNGYPGGNGSPIPEFASPIISPGIPAPAATEIGSTGLFAGGGGGSFYSPGTNSTGPGGLGGPGGGGDGGGNNTVPTNGNGQSGFENTGGGGGGAGVNDSVRYTSGAGGKGIVIIRYLTS